MWTFHVKVAPIAEGASVVVTALKALRRLHGHAIAIIPTGLGL
jgi:hypothetical protein